MRKYIINLIFLIALTSYSTAQDTSKYRSHEKEYIRLFEDFRNYMVKLISSNADISDTARMKDILLNYVVSDYNLDSTNKKNFKKDKIPERSLAYFEREIQLFYQFFFERRKLNLIQHLKAIPIRLYSDLCLFEKFTPFQRENTFVYFDDRSPNKPLGYLLFVPKFRKEVNQSRIWSWTLQFNNGYWAFKSAMGEVGMEYFISEGVKGPEHPIGN